MTARLAPQLPSIRWFGLWLALVLFAPGVDSANAQGDVADIVAGESGNVPAFGPLIVVSAIEITGNRSTKAELIQRALLFSVGDSIAAGDARLATARFKILALGFFREVTLRLRRGQQRGTVVISIDVVERGTLALNRLWFGSSTITPWWLGADVSERNLFGTGMSLGGGLIYAQSDKVVSSQPQWGVDLRFGIPSIKGSRWGFATGISHLQGAEAYRVTGRGDDSAPVDFAAFTFRRSEVRTAAMYDLSPLTRLSVNFGWEHVDAQLPVSPRRRLADGRSVELDLKLAQGRSNDLGISFGIDRDTRPDPVLPHAGYRVSALAQIGVPRFGDYQYAGLLARYEGWLPIGAGRHAFGVRAAGGVIIGKANRFDQIHVSDVNRMATPRAMGLLVSATPSLSIAGTRRDKAVYGNVGGTIGAEYTWRLFRSGSQRVYGGDLFVGAGLWGLLDADDAPAVASSSWRKLPVDMFFDAGIRIDTDVGAFEFTIANALGRLPL
jgi:outer membrane protein insertion porin family